MHKSKQRLQEKLTYLNREIALEQDYLKSYNGESNYLHKKAVERYKKLTIEKEIAENELIVLEVLNQKTSSR